MSTESNFLLRKRIILTGLGKSSKSKDNKVKKEIDAFISIAATSSAIENETKASALLRLIAHLMD